MKNRISFLIILSLLLTPLSSHAYNFLYIHPTTGEPIGWEPGTTIRYYLDPGGLGRLTNEQAHTLLKEAMKIWENASPYADVPHFEFGGYLPEDVDGGNYQNYVSLGSCYSDDLSSCPTQSQKDLQTVIIFDDDQTILNNEFCRIGSCAAYASAAVFSRTSSNPEHIVQGFAVFDGSHSMTSSEVVGGYVHELGHLLGLAHTYLNQQFFLDSIILDNKRKYLPTMELYTSYAVAGTGHDKAAATLNLDDIAGISSLYPAETFSQNTGTIKGETLKSDGTAMMYANVVARNVADPLCEAYSWLSGRITLGWDPSGEFVISGLPPGTYTLEVEEIADEDLAFSIAPGLVDPFISGNAEFWNESDQASEDSLTSSTITVGAGSIIDNIDIVLSDSTINPDRSKMIPLTQFQIIDSTSCQDSSVDYDAIADISNSNNTRSSSGGCSLIAD